MEPTLPALSAIPKAAVVQAKAPETELLEALSLMNAPPRKSTHAVGQRRKPPRRAILLGGFAAAVLLCGMIVITITNRDGTKTTLTLPEGTEADIRADPGAKVVITQTVEKTGPIPPPIPLDLTPPKPLGTWEVGPEPQWATGEAFSLRESPVLPGLIDRPRPLPGVKRWNVDTVLSRGFVNIARYSPDSKWLATSSYDGHLRIYNAETMRLHRLLPGRAVQAGVVNLSWHPDSDRLALVGDNTFNIRVLNLDGELLVDEPSRRLAQAISWNNAGTRFAVGYAEPEYSNPPVLIELRDETGEVVQEIPGPRPIGLRPGNLLWSPDDKLMAALHDDGKVRLWNLETGTAEWQDDIGSVPPPSYGVAWSSQNRLAILTGKEVRIYDPDRNLAQTVPYTGSAVAWHPDGQRMFFCEGNVVKVWDYTRQAFVGESAAASIGGYRASPSALSCSPDGQRVVMGAGLLRVWTADLTKVTWESPASMGWVTDLAWSPDGQKLASATWGTVDDGIRLWTPTGRSTGFLPEPKSGAGIGSIAWSPDSQTLLGCNEMTGVWLSEHSAPWRRVLPVGVNSANWSADGQHIAVGTRTGKVVILNGNGKAEIEMTAGTGDVRIAWSRTTNLLAVHCGQQLQICDPEVSWKLKPWTETGTPHGLTPVWSLDGELLSIVNDGWYARDGKRVADTSRPHATDWRADGKFYSQHSGGLINKALPSGTLVNSRWLNGFAFYGLPTRWHPNGHLIATGTDQGAITAWDASNLQPYWSTVLLPRRKTATFSAAGELIDGNPDEIDDYLVYYVEREPGKIETLTPAQFRKLVPAP